MGIGRFNSLNIRICSRDFGEIHPEIALCKRSRMGVQTGRYWGKNGKVEDLGNLRLCGLPGASVKWAQSSVYIVA